MSDNNDPADPRVGETVQFFQPSPVIDSTIGAGPYAAIVTRTLGGTLADLIVFPPNNSPVYAYAADHGSLVADIRQCWRRPEEQPEPPKQAPSPPDEDEG